MKTMSVRAFLRGEYKNLNEPTLVMNYSQPVGIWSPVSDQNVTFTSAMTDPAELDDFSDWSDVDSATGG